MQVFQTYLLDPFTKDIFDYKSRMGRKSLLFFLLSLCALGLLLWAGRFCILLNPADAGQTKPFLFYSLCLLVCAASAFAALAAFARRLNDAKLSKLWLLCALVPILGWIALIALAFIKPCGYKKPAAPEHSPVNIFTFFIAALALSIAVWNITLFVKAFKRAKVPWYDNQTVITAVQNASPKDLRYSLNRFTKLELKNQDGDTALIYAVRKHPVKEMLKVLTDLRADINATRPNGDTPLYIALVKNADLNTIKFLIEQGAKVNIENEKNITPLMIAAKRCGHKTVALMLLNGANPANTKGTTVQDWANPQNPVTKALLKLAQEEVLEQSYKDRIYKDVTEGKDVSDRLSSVPREAQELKKEEADLSTRDAKKAAALKLLGNLHDSFKDADETWAKKMVSKGLSMDVISDGGQTPLMYAAMLSSDTRVLDVFIKAGCNINAKDDKGVSALAWAVGTNPEPEIALRLIQLGADVNAEDEQKMSVLAYAAMQTQNPQVIDALVKAGADVNRRGAGGATPLLYAALYNTNEEVTEALLENGADVKATDAGGTSIAKYASENKNPSVLGIITSRLVK